MPGTSIVTVYNRALFKIGVTAVADPSESTPQARVVRTLFASVARSELRKHAWNFAITRTQLPALTAAPAWGFDNAFQLPADFLRLLEIQDVFVDPTYRDITPYSDQPYAIENGQILTSVDAPLSIRYIRDLSDAVNLWDDNFVEAFACALAGECAPQLVKSDKTAMRAYQQYKQAIFDARRANAIERPPQVVLDSSWVTSRIF